MTVFFGFALADSMFEGECTIRRWTLSPAGAKVLIARGIVSCCNPSHGATIDAMRARFGLDVSIPETPSRVVLAPGDSIIVMGVRGLPRMTDRHEYSSAEIAAATFTFTLYAVDA
jgi:hypothetical protein